MKAGVTVNRNTLITVIILAAAVLALGVYLYQHLERYEKYTNTGPSLKVLLNPWFAAQRFLERHNIESHRSHDLHSILGRLKPDDTLVLFNDTAIYSASNRAKLEEWMQSGGHLIIAANYEWDEEEESSGDPFLDAYGVRMSWTEEDEEAEEEDEDTYEEEATENDAATADEAESDIAESDIAEETETVPAEEKNATATAEDSAAAKATDTSAADTAASTAADDAKACSVFLFNDPFKVAWDGSDTPLTIDFGYQYTLDDASGKATGNADHWPNGLLQYEVGKGLMTVMVDTDIWMNDSIGDYDHAFLLWYLVGGSPNVWLVVSNDSDDLLTLLWRSAKYWMMGLIAMLLIWGWRRWVRFGPLIPDPTADRRQLREHLDAEARFSWQQKQMEPLLKAVRDDIWLRLSQQHGVQNHSPDQHDSALQKLAEISQHNADKVRTAMTCAVPVKELQWVELISDLQTIRNAL